MRGGFVPPDTSRADRPPIFSRDVLDKIASGDNAWKSTVPDAVAPLITQCSFIPHSKPRD
jgi:hypothetical protein